MKKLLIFLLAAVLLLSACGAQNSQEPAATTGAKILPLSYAVEFEIAEYPDGCKLITIGGSDRYFVIPADVKDSEFAGRITEALAVASHEYVIPAYYEVTLKTKTARDDDSYRMLDIIRSGFTLDFAAEYAMQTGQSGYMIRNALSEKNHTLPSSRHESTLMRQDLRIL